MINTNILATIPNARTQVSMWSAPMNAEQTVIISIKNTCQSIFSSNSCNNLAQASKLTLSFKKMFFIIKIILYMCIIHVTKNIFLNEKVSFEAWAKLAQQWLVYAPLEIHLEPINKELMLLVTI